MVGPGTVLATGTTCPDARFLALAMGGAGQTRLQRLGAFIRQNPEHLDARRDRYALLRRRMPSPALEPLLAGDAAAAWIPLDFDRTAPWIHDVEAWEKGAKAMAPDLEAALGRWPSSRSLWRAWVSWLPFRSPSPSPWAFANSLPIWRPRGEWLADLPRELHLAVASELRKRRRFVEMRNWFQEAWTVAEPRKEDPAGNRDTLRTCLDEARAALQVKSARRPGDP
jgi:hypothetical protein